MKHYIIHYLQKHVFHASNSYEPREKTGEKRLDNGCTLYHDIAYATQYPNSFLDIYAQPNAKEQPHDTLFYIHGGGYTWGDKADGDPNAKGADQDWFFRGFMEAGYNIVSVNYALATEYLYPTPVIQLGQAVEFLKQKGDSYGIHTDRLIVGGGSAGGQLSGQFANIQTNHAYAKEIGISPVLQKGDIKAVIFQSALADSERAGNTDTAIVNFLFVRCGRAYFNCRKLSGCKEVIQSSVIRHVTADFPPSFISDGNTGSYTDQNRELAEKLQKMGVQCTLNIYPKSEAKLGHGFESTGNQYGRDNFRKTMEFLNSLEWRKKCSR